MVDELALNKAAERAARAQRLIEDELLSEAIETLKSDYMKAWLATGARDTDARERLWQAVQIVGKVKDHLQMVMAGGRLANRELAELQGRHGTFKSN